PNGFRQGQFHSKYSTENYKIIQNVLHSVIYRINNIRKIMSNNRLQHSRKKKQLQLVIELVRICTILCESLYLATSTLCMLGDTGVAHKV
ncbi:hypothetical protein L9F63_013417, partial [Diploptera punctata]